MTTQDSTELLRWFADIGNADGASVGNKAASLGELHRAGASVPPGFAVTTRSFDLFVTALECEQPIRKRVAALDPDDAAGIAAACNEIRRRIERASLPDEVQSEIAAAYLCLRNGGLRSGNSPLKIEPPVAVRSSVTREAGAGVSGLQETFLWVRGLEGVAHAVRSCWASLYGVESVTQRLRAKVAESKAAMGVVVQRMVNSQSAGVMFTQSPVTGDRSVISIEGSWGLGSSVVSGEVTPDQFVVSKATGQIMTRTIAEKQLQHLPDHFGGGVRHEPVPDEEQKLPCLSDAQIAALVRIATRVERHYGTAQDIEWAFGPDQQKAFLLQSRPIATKPSAPLRLAASTT